MRKNKLLLLLALLLTAATGAWADETPLVTIESTGYTTFKSGSKTFDDKVTVTFSNEVTNDGNAAGWYSNGDPSLLTVAGINGYTITSCKFYTQNGDAKTGYTVEGESPSVYLSGWNVYTDASQSGNIGSFGVTKIEVFGTAPATGYTVSMKDGVKDADKWTVKVGEGQAQALPIGGLKGDGSETVTLQYTGRLKVKGVKATSEAAEASVPDGALSGKFSVSDGKQVYFSKGNLRYASSKWSFFDNQYDFYIGYSADTWDKFGWSTSATTYGMNTSTSNNTYSGDFVDWGATMGTGWFTLSSAEWTYLLKTRSASTVGGTENGRYAKAKVNNVPGVILFPDTYTHPDGVTAPVGVNAEGNTGWNGNSYTVEDWTKMESAGCVFLPAAGYRSGSSMDGPGTYGYYWTATPNTTGTAYRVYSNSDYLAPDNSTNRRLGLSVRLVREVATSDAGAPAAPTGNSVDLSSLSGDYEAQNGDVLTGETTSNRVTIAAGATVTLDGVTISSSGYCIKCLGDATIILKDGSTNTLTSTSDLYPALSIGDANTTLTIQGSTGVLNVTSGNYCAGIGGGYKNTNKTCGNIRIEGGVITAQGGYGGAGIGSDYGTATCGDIIITGGTITAKGGSNAAGIGTGGSSIGPAVCGNITIANTVTKVTATKGENATHSIGKGYGGLASCGTVTIGGTKYWENNAAVNGGDTYLAQNPLIYDPSAPAKEPATVTTAPTGAAIVGVGKSTALVSGGAADGGTLMYAVTTTNTKPTSTDGFSDAVPTAEGITASGKVYVWYYVKGDGTHTDSEIAATAIEVPVADIVWDVTNVSGMNVSGTGEYEKEGVKLSGNAEEVYASWSGNGNPETDGIRFDMMESGGYTFTAPTGKKFTKIEMNALGTGGWDMANLGEGWTFNVDWDKNTFIGTWTGSAASAVGLLTGADEFQGDKARYIAFYLSE